MDSRTNNSRRVAKNTGYLFIRTLLVLFVGLFTSRVILSTLGFEDFGIYNVVGSVVVFFSFFKNALTNATSRFLTYELGAGNEQKLGKVYSMAINCHILLAILVWIVMEFVGVWFINHKLNIDPCRIEAARWAYQFSLITFCISIIQTPFNSNIIAHEKMDFYAIISIAEVLLKLLVVYILQIADFDKLIFYSALITIVTFVVFLWYLFYCKFKLSDCVYGKYWDSSLIKQFASYSGLSLIVNAVDITTTQCISIFFNMFIGVLANAALGIANQVISAITQFLGTFTQAFNPQIIKSYAAKDYDYFLKLIYSTSKLSFFLLFIISFPAIINIRFLLSIWLGDYPSMAPSFVSVMILYSLLDSLQAPLWQAVHATGQLKTHQILVASIKVFAIPIMFFVLKCTHSAVLALISWVLVNLVTSIARTVYMKCLIGLDIGKYWYDVILKVLTVVIVSAPLPLFITREFGYNSLLGFICSSVSFVVIACFVIYTKGVNTSEKNIINSMFNIKRFIQR